MSGTNVLSVSAVATNSDFAATSSRDIATDNSVALSRSGRQASAADGNTQPLREQPAQAEVSREAVVEAVKTLAESIEHMARKLEFSISEPSGKVVVTVFDKTSEEIIRQIPGERAIAIAEHIASLAEDQPILGLLLDSQA